MVITWNWSHLENPPPGHRAHPDELRADNAVYSQTVFWQVVSQNHCGVSTLPLWPPALLNSPPNVLQFISAGRKIFSLSNISHVYQVLNNSLPKGKLSTDSMLKINGKEVHWQCANCYSKYHTIALSSSLVSGMRQSNVCLKSLAVVEGKEDGKVTQLITLQ